MRLVPVSGWSCRPHSTGTDSRSDLRHTPAKRGLETRPNAQAARISRTVDQAFVEAAEQRVLEVYVCEQGGVSDGRRRGGGRAALTLGGSHCCGAGGTSEENKAPKQLLETAPKKVPTQGLKRVWVGLLFGEVGGLAGARFGDLRGLTK